jgi:LPXTG-site transpeptidase (sortase) family protein
MPIDVEDQLQALGRMIEKYSPPLELEAVMTRQPESDPLASGTFLELDDRRSPRTAPMRRRVLAGLAVAPALVVALSAVLVRHGADDRESQASSSSSSPSLPTDRSCIGMSCRPVPAPDAELVVNLGDPIGYVTIVSLGLNETVLVLGTRAEDTQNGLGVVPNEMPGHVGNVVIVGERTTYGAPFLDLDKLQPSDEIVIDSLQGHFVYRVDHQTIVGASDASVLGETSEPTLTLITCHPKYTAKMRLVVVAVLDREASSPPADDLRGVTFAAPPPTGSVSDGSEMTPCMVVP